MRINGLTCMFRGWRASSMPRLTPNPPKRSPIEPKWPIFGCCHLIGLHFGEHSASSRGHTTSSRGHTTSSRGFTATKRGELHYMRVRHAGDTPPEGFM